MTARTAAPTASQALSLYAVYEPDQGLANGALVVLAYSTAGVTTERRYTIALNWLLRALPVPAYAFNAALGPMRDAVRALYAALDRARSEADPSPEQARAAKQRQREIAERAQALATSVAAYVKGGGAATLS